MKTGSIESDTSLIIVIVRTKLIRVTASAEASVQVHSSRVEFHGLWPGYTVTQSYILGQANFLSAST